MVGDVFDDAVVPERVAHNVEQVVQLRSMVSLYAGVVAGVLGLTGYFGFAFFVAQALSVSLLLDQKCKSTGLTSFFPKGRSDIFTFGSLTTGVLIYIFVWTVIYDVIYLF